MDRKKFFRILLGITVLVGASLACRTFTSARQDVEDIQSTAQAMGTAVGDGQDLLETGQALATQVDESGLKETVAAAATQLAESGLLETARAAATEYGPDVKETLQAIATDFPDSQSPPPAGIPLMDGERSNYYASDQFVSYTIKQDFQIVLDFYEREMPDNGWVRQENGSTIFAQTATVVFQKDGRTAFVAIMVEPVTDQIAVVVTIQ